MMLKSFNGQYFRPHQIIPLFLMQLGGKIVTIKVEVVDSPLEFNLLLCQIWI
jgi:hypothetical protein